MSVCCRFASPFSFLSLSSSLSTTCSSDLLLQPRSLPQYLASPCTTLLRFPFQSKCSAEIAAVEPLEGEEGRFAVVLDRTVMHPQGGGQPSDTGTITVRTSAARIQSKPRASVYCRSGQRAGKRCGRPFAFSRRTQCTLTFRPAPPRQRRVAVCLRWTTWRRMPRRARLSATSAL